MPSTPSKKMVMTSPRLADRGRKLGYAPGVLAWSLWVLSVAFETGAGVFVLTRKSNLYSVPDYSDLLLALSFLPLGAVGALVAMKRSPFIIGWLFCFANVAASLWLPGEVYTSYPLAHRDLVSTAVTFARDLAMLALACSLLLFPEGRVQAGASRPVGWVQGAGVPGYVLTQVLHAGPLLSLLTAVGIRIPFGVRGPAGGILYQHILALPVRQALIIVILGLAVLSGLVRLRRARGVERQQLKWFVFAAILPVAGLADLLLIDWGVGTVLTGAGVSALAVAVGLAIVRHRLYDIDVIINRTLVYGTVTAMLAGLFAGLSILTQRIVLALTGQESQAALVLAALVVTALFPPLRAHVQIVVDRRFYRRKYDTTQTLERFASQVRDEVELDQLTARLVAVVHETMQPSHGSLWLQPSKDRKPSVHCA